jgi:hypothetical protein
LNTQQRATGLDALQSLLDLVREDDSGALTLWQSQRDLLHALLPGADQIEAAMEGFDFDKALALLEAASPVQ